MAVFALYNYEKREIARKTNAFCGFWFFVAIPHAFWPFFGRFLRFLDDRTETGGNFAWKMAFKCCLGRFRTEKSMKDGEKHPDWRLFTRRSMTWEG
jgi:hypothetical protein